MMTDRVPSLLHDLLKHANRLKEIAAQHPTWGELRTDRDAADALLWNFVALGEISIRLGDEYQAAHPEIPWKPIIAQRNVIAHGYDVIDWDRLRPVIENEIDSLIAHAKNSLDSYGAPPND